MNKLIHIFISKSDIWDSSVSLIEKACFNSILQFYDKSYLRIWDIDCPEFLNMLSQSRFLLESYKKKNWKYVSQYVKYYVLYNYGGIFIDNNIQIIKNFDSLFDNEFFCSFKKSTNNLNTSFIGGSIHNIIFKKILEQYNSSDLSIIRNININTILTDIVFKLYPNLVDNNLLNNNFSIYKNYLNQTIIFDENHKISLYPSYYFSPAINLFRRKAIQNNTYSIDWNVL